MEEGELTDDIIEVASDDGDDRSVGVNETWDEDEDDDEEGGEWTNVARNLASIFTN